MSFGDPEPHQCKDDDCHPMDGHQAPVVNQTQPRMMPVQVSPPRHMIPTQQKLRATEIEDFSDRLDHWLNWKLHTECAFNSVGCAETLTSREHAANCPHDDDNTAFAQLNQATCSGTAHHFVHRHEATRDRQAAWHGLLQWSESGNSEKSHSARLHGVLTGLELVKGDHPQWHINKFTNASQDLNKIFGEEWSKENTIETFLEGFMIKHTSPQLK